MLTIISPSKALDFKSEIQTQNYSDASFLSDSEILVKSLRKFTPKNLAKLMGISNDLADLNYERYLQWKLPFTKSNSKQALAVFRGQVFLGLNAKKLSEEDLLYAQDHLRILSGLYGILRPLDLIRAYRLEMGTSLKVGSKKNLYEFWGNKISENINSALLKQKHNVLVNLASNEYFKVIKKKLIKGNIITPVFKESKGNGYKVIMVYAKTARGLMSRFILENKIEDPEEIKAFDTERYIFNESMSSESEWVFVR